MTALKKLEKYLPALLLLGSAALFFLPLGTRALWDSDEGRYAEIAREMLQLKDWLTPHLNYVLYFEKPPLMYWLTAITLWVFGQNAFAARFWCAVFGVLTVGVTYRWGKHWKNKRTGLLAGGILATSLGFFALTQYFTLDMALTFWMTLSLYAGSVLLLGHPTPQDRGKAYLLALAIAVGILTKGPVALALPLLAMLWVLVAYRGRRLRSVKIPWKSAFWLCAALTLPWFIWVSLRHPVFTGFFLIREHFLRYLTAGHHRNQPFYFFLPVLAVGFFPWVVFLPQVLASWWSRRRAAFPRDPTGALLFIWVLVVFVFFSLSHSKLASYILPIFPALALLLANEFDEAVKEPAMPRWISGGVVTLIVLLVGGVCALKHPAALARLDDPLLDVILTQGSFLAVVLGLGVFVLVGVRGMRRVLVCYAGVLVFAVMLLASLCSVAPLLDPCLSTRALAQAFVERMHPGEHLLAYGVSFENRLQSLAFYTGQRIAVFGDFGELDLGQRYDPDAASWFVPEDLAHEALVHRLAGTWGVTDEEHWRALSQSDIEGLFQAVDHQGSLVLFQKVH